MSFLWKRLVLLSETPRVSSASLLGSSVVVAYKVVPPLPGCFTMPKLLSPCQYWQNGRAYMWGTMGDYGEEARHETYIDFL